MTSDLSDFEDFPFCDKAPVVDFFNSKFPVYNRSIRGLSAKEVITVVLEDTETRNAACDAVPMQCEENATFVIDTSKLKNIRDFVDNNGKWSRPYGCSLHVKKNPIHQAMSPQGRNL